MFERNNFIPILLLFFLLIPIVSANAEERQAEEEPNIKEIVFDHIGDSYSWHITDIGDKHITVYLPVIVRSSVSGWHVFFSSKLDGEGGYMGFHIAKEGKYAGKVVERNGTGEEVRPGIDISFTKNALGLMINCMVLLLVILPLAAWYRKDSVTTPPKGFRGAVEMLLLNIQDEVVKPCVGEGYAKYSPYLLTVFFFIFVNNLMGLIPLFPGGANITGNITITLFLAVCTFLVVNFSGTKEYWKEIFWSDVPIWLKVPLPIIPVIELFGIFTKPFALMIRLFANIMAGHSIILGLTCLIFITASMGAAVNSGMWVISVTFSVFMNCVELLVAYIQAYVFTLLSAVFIGMARAKHEKKTIGEQS